MAKFNKSLIKGPTLRLSLLVLQGSFVLLLGTGGHLPQSPYPIDWDQVLVGLLVVPLLLLCLPGDRLTRPWVGGLMLAANAGVVLRVVAGVGSLEAWAPLAFMVLILLASFLPTLTHFLFASGTLCLLYGGLTYRFAGLAPEHLVTIPVMLALVMVVAKKTALVRAVMERGAKTEDKIRSESLTDALTGLPNRAQFLARVWRAIECGRNNADFMFAVLFVDLDGFKPINDNMGHKVGDAVLIETSRRLQSCLRKGDVVARYGGDEFTLLVNNVNGKADAIRVAERVLRKVVEPILIKGRVQVGASIGIALSTNIHERPEDLIRDADLAMYRAKSQGKGRYEISDQLRDAALLGAAREKLG